MAQFWAMVMVWARDVSTSPRLTTNRKMTDAPVGGMLKALLPETGTAVLTCTAPEASRRSIRALSPSPCQVNVTWLLGAAMVVLALKDRMLGSREGVEVKVAVGGGGVKVRVLVGVGLGSCVRVAVGVEVRVGVSVVVGVGVSVGVRVAVGVSVGVTVGVSVGVSDGVTVGKTMSVGNSPLSSGVQAPMNISNNKPAMIVYTLNMLAVLFICINNQSLSMML